MNNRRTNLTKLCECAIMLALATALSYVVLWEMPYGGTVTLMSMLPILIVGYKNGLGWGLGTGLAFSLIQLLQGLSNFSYCQTAGAVIICTLFDYIIPFTVLGAVALFRPLDRKRHMLGFYVGTGTVIFIRFVCHFISGVTIWKQFAPEGMGAWLYSFVYQITYLLPELALVLIGGALIFDSHARRILGIDRDYANRKASASDNKEDKTEK